MAARKTKSQNKEITKPRSSLKAPLRSSAASKSKDRVAASASPKRKIRYAVVGLGDIAQGAVLPAFKHARKNSELTALVSSDPKKLKLLGKKYGVDSLYSYEDFEECLKSGNVDAVYIALPNNMHRPYMEKAAQYGIHVLCEKPLAKESSDCQKMIKAAKSADIRFMTAYRLHFDKANMHAVEIAQSGKLGELRYFTSTFSQRVRPGNIRVDDELGGGPLYDIGIYCINATRYLFREAPTEVFAFASSGLDDRFTETDEMVSAILRYPEGRIASFVCSFAGSATASYQLIGTEGSLTLESAYSYTDARKLQIKSASGKTKEKSFPATDQFAAELLYFSNCIITGTDPEPGGLEGKIDVQIIEALEHSIRTGRPVRLSLRDDPVKAGAEQVISKPRTKPVRKVDAESPTV